MSDFRRVTDQFAVSPQIALADIAEAARQGFTLLINNRPDDEEAGQPPSSAVAAAAAEAGLAYVHIPVRGGPSPDQVQEEARLLQAATGPALAFCRSGTRSIVTWALGQAMAGTPRDELVAAGEQAGYDLGRILPR
jgi:uncharacterized protein (TIGR01244 family)